jgi:quinone-modifying oxidoreductase subunit QmoA
MYLREQNPDSKAYVFYIDIRTPGKYEQFYWKVKEDPNVSFIKGKVAKVTQDSASDDVVVEAEDMLDGGKTRVKVDMVVLATGMEPSGAGGKIPGVSYAEEGFAASGKGIFAAGCTKSPLDVSKSVQDATGAALRALRTGQRR